MSRLQFVEKLRQHYEDIIASSHSNISSWNCMYIAIHCWILYIVLSNVPTFNNIGTLFYTTFSLCVTVTQIGLRYWRLMSFSNDFIEKLQLAQCVFCVANMSNQLMQVFIAFSFQYFDADSSVVFVVTLLCILGWVYYAAVIMYCILQYYLLKRSRSRLRYIVNFLPYEDAKKTQKKYNKLQSQSVDAEPLQDSSSDSSESSDCPICLDTFESKGVICQLKCKHYFHIDCIHEWLKTLESTSGLDYKCPLCRQTAKSVENKV